MKRYLLIAGTVPEPGTGDWINHFHVRDEAVDEIDGPYEEQKNKNGVVFMECEIRGRKYDWFEIVDTHNWR